MDTTANQQQTPPAEQRPGQPSDQPPDQAPVAVGVGTEGAAAAVAYAVEHARRTGRPLELLHVLEVPSWEAYAGVYGANLDGVRRDADATLERATELARGLASGEVPVTARLLDGGIVTTALARAAADAGLLVLEHRALGRLARVLSGSVVQGLVGRAAVPVVSVPDGWAPRVGRSPVVTAAVQDPQEATVLLRAAFTEARARGAAVVVLHAWWLASGYDSAVVDEEFREQWATRSRAELAPVLDPLRAEFPDVEVAVEVRHAPPVEAVLDGAAASDLLVIGRRHHLLPLGTHLGPVARAAVGHAACPVMFTPEPAAG